MTVSSVETAPGNQDWQEEMKVTFDSEELESFYDGFIPLELDEEGFPADPDDP